MLQIKVGIALSFVISLLFSDVPKPEGLVFPAFSNPSRSEGAWRTGLRRVEVRSSGEVCHQVALAMAAGSGLALSPASCSGGTGMPKWASCSGGSCPRSPCAAGLWEDGWASGSDLDPHGLCFSNFPTRSSCQRRWDSDPSLQQPTPTVTLL